MSRDNHQPPPAPAMRVDLDALEKKNQAARNNHHAFAEADHDTIDLVISLARDGLEANAAGYPLGAASPTPTPRAEEGGEPE